MELSNQSSFVTKSLKMQALMDKIPLIAATGVNVLIHGESGTGKELLASLLHRYGPRANRPLLAINCAAIPETLLESELFGHRKGAFTGAINDHKGIFEAANGGTIFLDEIGDMPLPLQAKLLRVLQEKKIRPVGSCSEKPVDFNLIAATHRELKIEIAQGQFREDLYYRICVMPLFIPALRERTEDVPHLVSQFCNQIGAKYGFTSPSFTPQALEHLSRQEWKGNVRELKNLIEQVLVIHHRKDSIDIDHLPQIDPQDDPNVLDVFLQRHESTLPPISTLINEYINFVLEKVHMHQGEAAKILGVSRRTISRKVNPKNQGRQTLGF